jgi:hypothetical protein
MRRMYSGMFSIGPGRKREMAAMMWSKRWGFMSIISLRMPEPSTWKTPCTSPRPSISNAFSIPLSLSLPGPQWPRS